MGFEGILNQIYQPYFYYSVIFLILSFVSVKILTKYCSFISQKTKSLLYLVPLGLPLIVMLVFTPSIVIQTTSQQIMHLGTASTGGATGMLNGNPFLFPPAPPQSGFIIADSTTTVFSITGIICFVGLIAGALFALSMVLSDDRVARRVLHVILLSSNEHQWLQAKITEASKRLAISTPKIGVVEDLRPNAFTIGYGKNSTVVFSIGLFNILTKEEVTAVAFHELSHVRNHDFFFKTVTNALTVISFFNPLSYIISSNAQREREMLADENAVFLLEKPSALGNALAKIFKAIQTLPQESILAIFSSNLLVSSSVLHRVGILSTHPRLDIRLRKISAPRTRSIHWGHRNKQIAFFLSLLLIASSAAVTLAMADLQVNFTATQYLNNTSNVFNAVDYRVGAGNGTLNSMVLILPVNGTQTVHLAVYKPHLGTNNGNIYVETANNYASNGSKILVGGYFASSSSQNVTVPPMRPMSAAKWVG